MKKVFVTSNDRNHSHLRNKWFNVVDEDWIDGRDMFKINETFIHPSTYEEQPVWLYREQFQTESEKERQEYVIKYYNTHKRLPKVIPFVNDSGKTLYYYLKERVSRNDDGSLTVSYVFLDYWMDFKFVAEHTLTSNGVDMELGLKLHSLRYVGLYEAQYPEAKEYYVE